MFGETGKSKMCHWNSNKNNATDRQWQSVKPQIETTAKQIYAKQEKNIKERTSHKVKGNESLHDERDS